MPSETSAQPSPETSSRILDISKGILLGTAVFWALWYYSLHQTFNPKHETNTKRFFVYQMH